MLIRKINDEIGAIQSFKGSVKQRVYIFYYPSFIGFDCGSSSFTSLDYLSA